MTQDTVLRVSSVSKRFRLFRESERTLKGKMVKMFKQHGKAEDFWALQDVSFEVKRGESFGVIGRNGSGKSTLLKLLVGILRPTQGEIVRQGRISPLLELGAGFHPEFTGRENVFLNGAILGLSRTEIQNRYDQIVSFAGLKSFMDTPVKHYSAGMYVRLGFSVAIHVNPEILIIDEILAVGDEEFQGKCFERILTFQKEGATLVFVSHDLGSVANLCERGVWIDKGQVKEIGTAGDVVNHYLLSTLEHREDSIRGDSQEVATTSFGDTWGTGEVAIRKVRFLDAQGVPKSLFAMGEPVTVEVWMEKTQPVQDLQVGLSFQTMSSLVMGTNTGMRGIVLPPLPDQSIVRYSCPSLPFNSGEYYLSVALQDPKKPGHDYDYHERLYVLKVCNPTQHVNIGVVNTPDEWSFSDGWPN